MNENGSDRSAETQGAAPAGRGGGALATLALLLPFLALALTAILAHEMWRDELEIWLLGRDSATLSDLFAHIGTQAHPALWYLLAWGLARCTTNPLALQLLNLAIGAGAALVFFRRAPFGPLQRVLFCFGYYLFYEYTVISRSYALELLLLFAVCALFARRRRIGPAEAGLLFLLANTNLYGLIMAAQLVLLALLLWLPPRAERRPWAEARTALPLLVALAGVAASFTHILFQTLNASTERLSVYVPGYDTEWALSGLAAMARGFLPLQNPTITQSWNSSLLDLLPASWSGPVGALLGAACLALGAAALRRRPRLLAVFLLGTASMLAVALFFWYGYARHHGQFFIWLLCCLWLAASPAPSRMKPTRALSALLGVVLLLQLSACVWAVTQDLRRPFSQARAVGELLRGEEFRETILVGSVDYAVQPIAAFLDRPIWYPESARFGTFMDWGEGRGTVPVEQALQDAVDLFEEKGRDVVLILNYTPSLPLGHRLALGENGELLYFGSFTGSIVPDESYHLYLLRAKTVP